MENYRKLENQNQGEVDPEQLYQAASQLLKISQKVDDEVLDKTSLRSMFKEAESEKEEHINKIDISNIFKV